jgi:uncharacterized membrane protein
MTDERFELWIAMLLRAGVLAAAAIVLVGGIGILAHNGRDIPGYHEFHDEPLAHKSAPLIAAGAREGDWFAVIQFGLLVLIATPVARVALSIAAFTLERDWIYVGITGLVLGILMYSLL